MKHLLRTVAMLSAVAFLFCACNDDEVVEDTGVTAPEVTTLTSPEVSAAGGYTRTVVTVASVDENATSNVIACGDVVDTVAVSVTEYEIADLAGGNYSISVISINEEWGAKSTAASVSVKVYGEDDSADIDAPTILMKTSEEGVTITWKYLDDDCVGKVVEYGDGVVMEIDADEDETLITDAVVGETFIYYSLHQPEDCIDAVPSVKTEAEFEAISLDAASNLTVYPGYNRVKLTWIVPAEEAITGSNVTWGEDGSADVALTEGEELEDGTTMLTLEMDEMEEGDYTFVVMNTGASDAKSSTIKKSVTIYGDEYYAALEARVYEVVRNSEDFMVFTWEAIPADYISALLVYGDSNTEITIDAATTTTTIEDAEPDAEFTLTTTYLPTNGLDEMIVETTDVFPSYQLPYATDLVATAGNERVLLSYTVPADANITGATFTDGTSTYSVEITAEQLGTTLEYSFEGLSAGDATISVQMTGDGTFPDSNVVSADAVSVYDDAMYASKFTARQILDASYDETTGEATITLFTQVGCGDTYLISGGVTSEAIPIASDSTYSESVGTIKATEGAVLTIRSEYTPFTGALDPIGVEYDDVVPGKTATLTPFYMNGDAYPLNYAVGSDIYAMQYGLNYLVDGVYGSSSSEFYHTDTSFAERTFTADMGYEMEMTNFKLWPRNFGTGHYYGSHAPMYFSIYAANELTEEMQTAGGAASPDFTGWTKLGEGSTTSEYSATSTQYFACPPSGVTSTSDVTDSDRYYNTYYGQLFKVDTEGKTYRYVRILWHANWGSTGNIECTEFQVMGRYVSAGTAPENVVDEKLVFTAPSEITVAAGNARAVVSVTLPADDGSSNYDASQIKIQSGGADIHTYDIQSSDWGTTVDIEVALDAASYTLGVLLYEDIEGVYSETTYVSTTVYSDSSLSAPSYTAEYDGATGFTLTFDVSSIYDAEVSVTYTEAGNETTVVAEGGVLVVTDVDPYGEFSYTTTALPYENALDELTVTGTGSFPAFAYQVSSAGFSVVTLDGDAGVQSGYSIASLWNGVFTGNQYHNAQFAYSQAFTIDLGAEYDLGSFKIYQRQDRCYTLNNIRTFRIYGCTTDPDGDAELEKTMTYTASEYYDLTGVHIQNKIDGTQCYIKDVYADDEYTITVPDLSAWTPLYEYQSDNGFSAVCAANPSSHQETGYTDVAIIPDPASTWSSSATTDMQTESLLGDEFIIPSGAGKAIRYVRIQPMSGWAYVTDNGSTAKDFDGWVQFGEIEFFLDK